MPDKTDQEKQILLEKTEDAMLDGFDTPTEIGKIIDIERNTARNYIKLVQEKWARSKTTNIEEKRKELIRKLAKTEKDLSVIASAADQDTAKVGAINAKLKAFERQAKLLGLEVETIRHEKPKDRMSPESFETIKNQLEEREKPNVVPPPLPPVPPTPPVAPPVQNVNPTTNPTPA